MTISIDFNSPVIRIPGWTSKYDFAGVSNSLVRIFDDYLEARILQQFHFWLWLKKGGVILRGFKWIYKALIKLMNEAIVGFSEYQVRKAIANLVDKGILIREQLHREHYGGIHARSSYNRQYYYRIDYSALVQFIQTQIQSANLEIIPPRHLQATTTETVGFVNTTNQICDLHQPDLRISQINTDTTFRVTPSTSPSSPPNLGNEGEETRQSKNTKTTEKPRQQDSSNLHVPSQKKVKSSTTPFTDVVAKPQRVEQKVNKEKPVQKPVQTEAGAEAVTKSVEESVDRAVVPEDVGTDVNAPLSSETPVTPEKLPCKRHKVPKRTQPNTDFGQAPWSSYGQLKKFVHLMYESNFIKRQATNRDALINWVLNQLKQGQLHSFWNDFVNGLPIGASSQQEWEVEPGIPHPMFIEYLTEKLIKGNNTQTREQAIANALNITANPRQAIFFWKECKISLGNALSEAERHRALGVQAVPTPLWTKERPEPTLEEAANAGNKIQQIHSSTQAAIEATKNRQIEGGLGQVEGFPSPENTPLESDLWLDESEPKQKQKKPKISDFAGEKLLGLLSKGSGKTKSKSAKRYSQPDDWRRQPLKIESMSFSSINKALQDPILREELTPQLMLSDYELIPDEMGRILRIEKPPE